MQTFVPFADIKKSLDCLDDQRLNSQRSEARVILKGLLGMHTGWSDHPTMDMWRGHEAMLALYVNMAEGEWMRRGYRSTQTILDPTAHGVITFPWWWGLTEVHTSHQQALLTKLPGFYREKFPDRKLHWRGYQYVWPDATQPGVTKRGEWMP